MGRRGERGSERGERERRETTGHEPIERERERDVSIRLPRWPPALFYPRDGCLAPVQIEREREMDREKGREIESDSNQRRSPHPRDVVKHREMLPKGALPKLTKASRGDRL